MSPTRRYAVGLACVAALALAAGLLAEPALRPVIWGVAAAGIALQAPLGWWVVRSIGRPGFVTAWGAGLLARFAALAVAAVAVLPALGVPAAPGLLTLCAVLVALLAVEVVTLLGAGGPVEPSAEPSRGSTR